MHLSTRTAIACAASFTLLLAGCGQGVQSPDLNITGQPASVAIATGSNAALSVVATGRNLTYQWYKDGTAIADAINPVYVATSAGSYYVVVNGDDGVVASANATVTVTDKPVIATQPASAQMVTGGTQVLKVEAAGAALAYQWYRNGTAISGATAPTYAATGAGSYTVAVTNPAGTSTSSAAVVTETSNPGAPVITADPATTTVNAGTSATLSVGVSGAGVSYQWYKDGAALPGATEATYRIEAATSTNAGTYYVVVKNAVSNATSANAQLTVNVTSAGANTAAVVNAANAFLATLSTDQKTVASSATASATVLFDYTLANAIQWTNLPGDRHGLRLNASTLSAAQLAAANTLIATALSGTGQAMMRELRAADDVLASAPASAGGGMQGGGAFPGTGTGAMTPPDGTTATPATGTAPATGATPPTGTGTAPATGTGTGGAMALGYGANLYSIAFVGTPSKTSPWILQLAGHHLAYNITYNTGKVSATPTFLGVEPPNWTVASDGTVTVTNTATTAGTAHAPMERQRLAIYNLAEAIQGDSASAAAARLTGTFTDVVMGASGNSDGNYKTLAYPTTGRGLQYSAMSAAQKAFVRAAIEAWVDNQAYDVASTLLTAYLADDALNNTYVAYAVGQGGKADFSAYPNSVASPLQSQHSYLRIDGPRVWIEAVVQQGVVYPTGIHYHTIWRDKTADYGGSF